MNFYVRNYYKNIGRSNIHQSKIYEVFPLHEDSAISWKNISELVPYLPKIWYEVCQMDKHARIEAVFSYWLKVFYNRGLDCKDIGSFFQNLDDIGVFVFNLGPGLPYEVEMVYSMADESCFYYGQMPICPNEISLLDTQFDGYLPSDYLSFLQIHNGFSKHTDTGLFSAQDLYKKYRMLMRDISSKKLCITTQGHFIDPKDLIPFYESFSTKSYQCFLKEWNCASDVGNVFFSLRDGSVSNYREVEFPSNTLAFSSFFEWLKFYVEPVGEEWLM